MSRRFAHAEPDVPPGETGRTHSWPLASGSSEWLRLPRKTQIGLVAGRLRVHEPALWLADTLWQPVQCLSAGETLTLERAGWVRLEAGASCRVWLLLPSGLGHRLQTVLMRLPARAKRLAGWCAGGRERLQRRVAENS